jgi:methylated-DNA-[protein]-cysteine S-methyltransferase
MIMQTPRESLRYSRFDTNVGPLLVAYDDDRVWASMLSDNDERFRDFCGEEVGHLPVREQPSTSDMAEAIQRRIEGEGAVSFFLADRTPFQRAVLEAVAAIPRGEVRSYGEVALAVGRPGAARAVGEVMRTNRVPVLIPCHRVVRVNGDIGRYTPDPAIKRRLLVHEGALAPGS